MGAATGPPRDARILLCRAAIALGLVLASACTGSTPGASPTPAPTASPSTSEDARRFDLRARANTIETTGRLSGLTTMRLEGRFLLAATVETATGSTRRLLVDGGPLTLRGDGLGVLGYALTIKPGTAEVVGDPIPPRSKRPAADRASAFPRVFLGADVGVEGPNVLLDDQAVSGPQQIRVPSGSAVLYGTARLARLPAGLTVLGDDSGRAPRSRVATPTLFAWSGTGVVTLAGRRFEGTPLSLVASSLTAGLSRRGAGFDVVGSGRATQVAVDGRPRLSTTLAVSITLPERCPTAASTQGSVRRLCGSRPTPGRGKRS